MFIRGCAQLLAQQVCKVANSHVFSFPLCCPIATLNFQEEKPCFSLSLLISPNARSFTPWVCPCFGAEFWLLTQVQGFISVIEKVLLHVVFFKTWKGCWVWTTQNFSLRRQWKFSLVWDSVGIVGWKAFRWMQLLYLYQPLAILRKPSQGCLSVFSLPDKSSSLRCLWLPQRLLIWSSSETVQPLKCCKHFVSCFIHCSCSLPVTALWVLGTSAPPTPSLCSLRLVELTWLSPYLVSAMLTAT